MTTAFIDQLKAVLGAGGWLAGSDTDTYTSDLTGRSGQAILVARPASSEAVAETVRICAANDVAIVPQGGNTNVCGSAVPQGDGPTVVLSLSRMNRILSVDPACYTISAQAGATVQELQTAARAVDREFAPDWGARGTAMVGGAVATNGGGMNVLRYGNTREQVLGMKVVLPDGRVWDGMRALRKDNSGYDLKQLFIGSEGTLGIITELVFRLHPYQPHHQSMMAAVADMSKLMEFFARATEIGGEKLTAFELMPGLGIDKALERYPDLQRPLDTRTDWYLLVRFSGREPVEDDLLRLFESGFESGCLQDAVLTQSQAQEQNVWEIRDQMRPFDYFDRKMLKWDVSVPIDRIVEFLQESERRVLARQSEAIPYAVGHIGDGNIHYSVFPKGDPGPELEDLSAAIYEDIDQLIWSMGGSICAEHGVGLEMFDRLRGQKSALEYELMGRLRTLFDPAGIMNPGKLVAPR